MSGIGIGREPTSDELAWDALGESFTPAAQIKILNDKAESLVSRTAIVGTVLGAGGVTAVATILADDNAKVAAILAVVLSGLSVLLALSTQVRWPRVVSTGNLVQLRQWFTDYTRWRGVVLALASLLLVAAFVVAGIAVTLSLRSDSRRPTVGLSSVLTPGANGAGGTLSVSGTATLPADKPGDSASLTISSGGQIVATARQTAGADSLVVFKIEVAGLAVGEPVTIALENSLWTCGGDANENGELTCKAP